MATPRILGQTERRVSAISIDSTHSSTTEENSRSIQGSSKSFGQKSHLRRQDSLISDSRMPGVQSGANINPCFLIPDLMLGMEQRNSPGGTRPSGINQFPASGKPARTARFRCAVTDEAWAR